MTRLHSGVDDGDDRPGAVEATSPGLIGADERHTLGKGRRLDDVRNRTLDPEAGRLELRNGIGAYLQGQECDGPVLTQ